MEAAILQETTMDKQANYQITVRGILTKQWSDWFNGSVITLERSLQGSPYTILTCKVRDQAELFGILNKLNSLNLPLLNVMIADE